MSKENNTNFRNPILNYLFNMKIFVVLTNWTFQGMLYADQTERIFKISLDLFMMMLFYLAHGGWHSEKYIVVIYLIIAHTLNWLFNGQIFVLARYLDFPPKKQKEFSKYLERLRRESEINSSIQSIAVYGSLSRNKLNDYSDLDVRIIRKQGYINGLRACMFGLYERTWAFYNKFPLDLYVIDNFSHLLKMRQDETPIIVYDNSNLLNEFIMTQKIHMSGKIRSG
jgi:predicted nucleotidyltransferase